MREKDLVTLAISRLQADLDGDVWHERYSTLVECSELDLGYRIVISGGQSE